VLSACVAAVKCHPVYYHCVVIFFGLGGVSGVASFITTIDKFNKTEAAIFFPAGYAS